MTACLCIGKVDYQYAKVVLIYKIYPGIAEKRDAMEEKPKIVSNPMCQKRKWISRGKCQKILQGGGTRTYEKYRAKLTRWEKDI